MKILFFKVIVWISAFFNFAEISLEMSKSLLLTAVAGLQSTAYNATKNELLTKFVKGALKLTENVLEMISNGVSFCKLL